MTRFLIFFVTAAFCLVNITSTLPISSTTTDTILDDYETSGDQGLIAYNASSETIIDEDFFFSNDTSSDEESGSASGESDIQAVTSTTGWPVMNTTLSAVKKFVRNSEEVLELAFFNSTYNRVLTDLSISLINVHPGWIILRERRVEELVKFYNEFMSVQNDQDNSLSMINLMAHRRYYDMGMTVIDTCAQLPGCTTSLNRTEVEEEWTDYRDKNEGPVFAFYMKAREELKKTLTLVVKNDGTCDHVTRAQINVEVPRDAITSFRCQPHAYRPSTKRWCDENNTAYYIYHPSRDEDVTFGKMVFRDTTNRMDVWSLRRPKPLGCEFKIQFSTRPMYLVAKRAFVWIVETDETTKPFEIVGPCEVRPYGGNAEVFSFIGDPDSKPENETHIYPGVPGRVREHDEEPLEPLSEDNETDLSICILTMWLIAASLIILCVSIYMCCKRCCRDDQTVRIREAITHIPKLEIELMKGVFAPYKKI